jgi:hypothetical protein
VEEQGLDEKDASVAYLKAVLAKVRKDGVRPVNCIFKVA